MSGKDDLIPRGVLNGILSRFPKVDFAMGYGSGVIPQKGYTYKSPAESQQKQDQPLFDFIFAVSDAKEWHFRNYYLSKHADHYATIFKLLTGSSSKIIDEVNVKDQAHANLGMKLVDKVQRDYGAQIYYNTSVAVGSHKLKYGVISTEDLCNDLIEWRTLYVSGRMHKPVVVLQNHEKISRANEVNLTNAVRASLIMLPESFSDEEMFMSIAALSYQGDFRMTVGENPNKVKNIVSGNVDRFRDLYTPIIDSRFKDVLVYDKTSLKLKQNMSTESRVKLMLNLPASVKNGAIKQYGLISGNEQQTIREIVEKGQHSALIKASIGNIVKKSSWEQSLKGIVTAGISKSVSYAYQKVAKSIRAK